MATCFTAYNEYMATFDAEQRSKARSTAHLIASVARYFPQIDALDRREPKAPVDFHDEHSYDRSFRAEMRAAQQAEYNDNPDWRTR